MREGWEIKPLGKVCEIFGRIGFRGYNRTDIVDSPEEGAISLSPSNISNGKLTYEKPTYISWAKYEESPEIKIENNDVLFVKTGSTVGKCAKVENLPHPATINPQFVVLKNIILDNSYLCYYLQSEFFKEQLMKKVTGVAVPTTSQKSLNEMTVFYPTDKIKQQAVVKELDQINALIAIKEKQLRELEELEQTIFHEMFGDPIDNEKGWNVAPLQKNVKEMFLGPFGSSLKVDSYVSQEESYCMVYEQKHAIKGTIDLDNHYIDKEKFDSLERFCVKPGDFIMSCRGTIGKLYRLPVDAPIGIIHPSLMKIRLKEESYNPTFFQFMLVKIVANERTNGNCVQMAITAKALGEKKLIVPSMEKQESFAKRVKLIREQMNAVNTTKKDLEELLASRMQYWFD